MIEAWFDFDIRNDPVFTGVIRPFIEHQMKDLESYDRQRQALKPDILYIFHEHAERVAQDVRDTCARLGQPANVQEAMYWAMLAHDLGKKTLPVEVWDSDEKPTTAMKDFRRSHTERGLAVIDEGLGTLNHPFISLLRDVVGHHHEHMDGSGYFGLKGPEISMPARLCCIVESYDGYTIPRPHFGERDVSPAAVLEKMRNEADKGDKMYDMILFEEFARMKMGNN